MQRYMIVERFSPRALERVYRRLEEQGRGTPPGLEYLDSWVAEDLSCCYQLMECRDPELLGQWIRHWQDLCDFEVIPVLSSAEAKRRVLDGKGPPAPHT